MGALFFLLDLLLPLDFFPRFAFDFLSGEAPSAGFGLANDEDDDDGEDNDKLDEELDDELDEEFDDFTSLVFRNFDFLFSALRACSTNFSAHGWNALTISAG